MNLQPTFVFLIYLNLNVTSAKKLIKSQNVLSEAQVKIFFVR